MGPLGRVDLEEETTVTLQMLGGTLEAALNNCGTITVSVPAGIIARVPVPGAWNLHVKVIQGGTVTVKYDGGKEQFVAPGNEQYFDDVTEITSNGGAIVFEVDCRRRRLAPFLFAAPLGLLALLFGGDEAVVPVLSPAIPG
jgi:hypothetical protein